MTSPMKRSTLSGLQLVAALVDGAALSTIVLHVTSHLGLAPETTGLVLAGAAATAVVLAGPIGVLADVVGLRRAGAVATAGSACALLGYAVADSLAVYAASAVIFVVAQAAAGSIRQALAVAGVAAEARTAVRATMHTLLNTGLGAGTLVGAGLAAIGTSEALRLAYLAAGLLSILSAGVLVRGRGDGRLLGTATPAGMAVVGHDRPFLLATALAAVVQLTMPILSVILPVWVLTHTVAPAWGAAAALALNTVLVIATQRAWTAGLVDERSTAASARLAAVMLLGATLLLAVSGTVRSAAGALSLIAVGVVALTCGEVAGGAATWSVALRAVPPGAEGRYQSAFSMSSGVARIVGPGLALPLVVSQSTLGWASLGATMAAAFVGIAHLATPVPTTHRERNLT